jgi:hypothetical protein
VCVADDGRAARRGRTHDERQLGDRRGKTHDGGLDRGCPLSGYSEPPRSPAAGWVSDA